MISLRGVEKAFPHGPTKTYVLRRINLDIKPGEFVSIMGPSGAGKSTLLHILGMHDHSWTGEYYFDDVPVHKMDAKKRATLRNSNVGFVFQSYHLLDDQTVFENLELPLSYRDVSKKDRQSIVCDTLDRFQMVGKKDLFPTQLSGGPQQLVGIARAVVANPRIILADEPTGDLDSKTGRQILTLLRALADHEGVTLLMATHDPAAAEFATDLYQLRDGQIVERELRRAAALV
jgi:putative ABC transport system ATP-binding protein